MDLKQRYDFVCQVHCEDLDIGYRKQYITLESSQFPQEFEYGANSYFYTITFDPERFGPIIPDNKAKDYILYILSMVIEKFANTRIYGSFEYHKNGNIHAHCIIVTYQQKEITQYLKSKFTNNPKNKHCIDCGPARVPQAKEYIEKESDHYFTSEDYIVIKKKPKTSEWQKMESEYKKPQILRKPEYLIHEYPSGASSTRV